MVCGNSLAGKSRYTPPGRPESAARIARATPTPMSSACSTRNAALACGLAIGELVHLLVVALLQVDDLALARAADEDHRKAVGGGVGERRQAVEKAGGGYREADARLARHEAGDGRGMPGILFVTEGDHAHALRLQLAREVGDRDAGQAEDRIDAVELERIDDELKAVGFLRMAIGLAVAAGLQRGVGGRRRLPGFGGSSSMGLLPLRRRSWQCPSSSVGPASL